MREEKWLQMPSAGNPPFEARSQLADARAEPAVGAREVGVQEREPGARLPPPSPPRSPFPPFTAAHFSLPWTDCWGGTAPAVGCSAPSCQGPGALISTARPALPD